MKAYLSFLVAALCAHAAHSLTQAEFDILEANSLAHDPEIRMTTPEIIKLWGYPMEIHEVETGDGYILQMHRIPHGRHENEYTRRPVIFLQHGLEDSSATWTMNLPNNSAAFVFADAGFDVWLGNVRGNKYSRRHRKHPPKSRDFWRFSFTHMIKYDLDAMIGKALAVSREPSLYYVGHSQGTLIMFGKLSRDAEFAKKIRHFFALAPVATVRHIKGMMGLMASTLWPEFDALYKVLGDSEFIPTGDLMNKVAEKLCDHKMGDVLCKNILMAQMGTSSNQWNDTRIPIYVAHNPSGTSFVNILHWAQMVRSGKFREYDYGWTRNYREYRQFTPPDYDVAKINVPTHLFWSKNDWLADEQDIREFLMKNLKFNILAENHQLEEFNHVDFIWGMRATNEVYKPILATIGRDLQQRKQREMITQFVV